MLNLTKFYNRKLKFAGLGEILFDIYNGDEKLGGAPANFAYHCIKHGFESIVISAVGNDVLGQKALLQLGKKFLPCYIPITSYKTGFVNIKLDENKVPTYSFLDDSAYDHIPLTDDLLSLAKSIDVVCFGSLAQRNKESANTIQRFLKAMDKEHSLKIFDVNLRANFFNKEIINSTLSLSNVVKCNEDELPILCQYANIEASPETYYNYLKHQGVDCFILTCGNVSSTIYLNNEKSYLKTPKTNVIDTVGAGDCFTATFITEILKGNNLYNSHQKAVETAALICSKLGAMPDYEV